MKAYLVNVTVGAMPLVIAGVLNMFGEVKQIKTDTKRNKEEIRHIEERIYKSLERIENKVDRINRNR